jgi:hypothetical protein
MPAIPGTGGTGKWVALLLVVFVLLGGAVGGGLWWWNSKKVIAAGPGPVVDPTTLGTPVAVGMLPEGVDPPIAMVETTMVEPTMVETTMVEPTMVEVEPTMVETTMDDDRALAAAERAVARGRSAVSSGNLDAAIDALRDAQRSAGRNHAIVRTLRGQVAVLGARVVGQKASNPRLCGEAQALFRQLRGVGAEGRAGDQFYDGCPRP